MTRNMRRNTLLALGVVLFHVAALWALQSGLWYHAVEIIVPAELLSQFIESPVPKMVPPPPPTPPKPTLKPVVKTSISPPTPQPLKPPPPQPFAVADITPSPNAPVGVIAPQPPAPPMTAPAAEAPSPAPAPPPSPPAPQVPMKVELPSSDADYLQNPRPAYPPMSKRLGEQGKVIVRALIGTDGTAQRAEIRQSSGFERLDQAAIATVVRWRYTPGKRAGIPEAMWFNVPINFVLE